MNDVKKLQEERIKIFHDVDNSIIPKRVPVNVNLPLEVVAQYGNLDLVETQWDPQKIAEPAEKLCGELYSDVCPFGGSLRLPSFYTPLKSQSFIMGSNGLFQHPEVVGMLPEEYEELIKNPYNCIMEKILPRHYKALDPKDPVNAMLAFTKGLLGWSGDLAVTGAIGGQLSEKYGYNPQGLFSGGFTEAPFDFLSDQLRSFKGISMDIRRCPEKVGEACEALYPLIKKMGMPRELNAHCRTFMPLHMPTFMREKDFAKFWWPTFKRLLDDYAAMGIRGILFCEDNWMRYLDYLLELPDNTILMFEYGDPKEIKEKLGHKHIITGLYPFSYMKTHTKQESVDLAKKYIDTLAPGGKYIFGFDKNPLVFKDVNMENLCAVAETVRDYGVYSNPGEQVGTLFNKGDYKNSETSLIQSQYYKSWPEYKTENPGVSDFGAPKLQGLEEMLYGFIMFLLV